MKKKLEILIDFLKYQSGKEYKKDKFGLIHPPDEKGRAFLDGLQLAINILTSDNPNIFFSPDRNIALELDIERNVCKVCRTRTPLQELKYHWLNSDN